GRRQRRRHPPNDAVAANGVGKRAAPERDAQGAPLESRSNDTAGKQEGPAMSNRRQRARRAAFALVGALTISACGNARYPTYYTLHLAPSPRGQGLQRDIGTLAIEGWGCPDYLCEGRIVYRPTPAEIGFYQ